MSDITADALTAAGLLGLSLAAIGHVVLWLDRHITARRNTPRSEP